MSINGTGYDTTVVAMTDDDATEYYDVAGLCTILECGIHMPFTVL